MSLRSTQGRDFLLGIVAGAIGLAGLWHFHPEWHDDGSVALAAALQQRELLRSAAQPVTAVPPEAARSAGQPGQAFFTPVAPATAQGVAPGARPAAPDGVDAADPVPLAARDEPDAHDAAALVRDDPELAQLDSDLDRLRAQAESVTSHPAALRRDAARALAQRDACRDRACLLRWYARRKDALLAAF